MPVALAEFALFVVVLVAGVTQILWPIWRGTPLFPLFTSATERRLAREAERARQREVELRLTRDLTRQTLRDVDLMEEETKDVFKPERKIEQ